MDERSITMNNKRGQTTFPLIYGILVMFLSILGIIIVGIVVYNINSGLDLDVNVGQVNLRTVNAQTIGQLNFAVAQNADWWGIALIFGLILGLFLSSYFTRGSYPKVGVIVDIGVIFSVFILSLYLRAIYSDVVTALNSAGQNFAVVYLTNTNYFILNLPIFVVVIGAIMMILFHSGIPPKSEELNIFPQVVTG